MKLIWIYFQTPIKPYINVMAWKSPPCRIQNFMAIEMLQHNTQITYIKQYTGQ